MSLIRFLAVAWTGCTPRNDFKDHLDVAETTPLKTSLRRSSFGLCSFVSLVQHPLGSPMVWRETRGETAPNRSPSRRCHGPWNASAPRGCEYGNGWTILSIMRTVQLLRAWSEDYRWEIWNSDCRASVGLFHASFYAFVLLSPLFVPVFFGAKRNWF